MIYICCPANCQTGGPELLHQLGYKLRLLGFDNRMVYYNRKEGIDPVCSPYKKYGVLYEERIIDEENNIIIIPEVFICMVNNILKARKIIWWLSVDNAIYTEKDMEIIRGNKDILHFCQSYYAIDFLKKNGIKKNRIRYLSDYINSEFLVPASDIQRENIVVFNPRKGFEATAKLIAHSNSKIKWQALSGLTPAGMKNILSRAKVYIDFGNHPGKDRIPREAALCGCLVLTNRSGAAGNQKDVPISENYKFKEDEDEGKVLALIYDMLENYKKYLQDYKGYIEKIEKEYLEFEQDIMIIFEELTGKCVQFFDTGEEYLKNIISKISEQDYIQAFHMFTKYQMFVRGGGQKGIL